MKKILIIQTAFLGDVILATPLVSELKRIFPDSQLDFLVKKGNESLLTGNPKIQNVFVFDKTNGKYKSMWKLIREFRQQKYELVINLQRFGSSGILTALSGAHLKYGFQKNPFSFTYSKSFPHEIGNGTHEVERNLSVIQEFGAKKLVRPELFPNEQQREKVAIYQQNEPYFCMAPASVWFTKQLPAEKWIQLIQLKAEQGTVYLLGGKDDQALCQQLIELANVPASVVNLAGKLNLLESAALMEKATRNYVNDSGPLHIASAMNAPVTAFFCSTVPEFGFGPLSDDRQIKQTPEKLDCRPCGLHGFKSCPKGHFKCGTTIDVLDL